MYTHVKKEATMTALLPLCAAGLALLAVGGGVAAAVVWYLFGRGEKDNPRN